jgi:hypothetical protein
MRVSWLHAQFRLEECGYLDAHRINFDHAPAISEQSEAYVLIFLIKIRKLYVIARVLAGVIAAWIR